MAATQNVAQPFSSRKHARDESVPGQASFPQFANILPRHGVITLSGFGIAVRVDRGHLVLEDGIGAERRRCRLPRVDHGLKRLVVIGSDGHVSFSALSWLADQDAAFALLERDGKVLLTTGPVSSSDARLRRAQALALQNGAALRVSRELIDRKLAGQERVAREALQDDSTAAMIRRVRSELAEAESVDAVRLIESQGAKIYWSAWRSLTVTFPRKDLPRVPEHWRTFGLRRSSLTGSPRLATNPVNAILNFLYALLAAESRLAAAALGLDPGIGVLHVDTPNRDSLACDLMEPIRPEVDAFVLDWLKREPIPRNSFFEQRDGNCRLMAPFASRLSQTAPTWARLVAPIAEWVAQEICNSTSARRSALPARLTQRHRREAQGGEPLPKRVSAFEAKRLCHGCGEELKAGTTNCSYCAIPISAQRLIKAARLGRVASHAPEAAAKRSATQKINTKAQWDWKPSDQPIWLTLEFYSQKIQPLLSSISMYSIAKVLNVSIGYANELRKGRVPHPRHWKALAELSGLSHE